MTHPIRSQPTKRALTRPLVLAALLPALLSFASAARAQVTVDGSTSFNSSLYTFTYSVTNNATGGGADDSFDLAIVSIPGAPNSSLMNFSAPAGYQIDFDAGNGFFSFSPVEGAGRSFTPGTTVAGFSFTTPFAPGTATFEALDVSANTFTGATIAPVPEPASVALVLSGLAVAGLAYRRRLLASR